MSRRWIGLGIAVLALYSTGAQAQSTLGHDNAELLQQLQSIHGLTEEQMRRIQAIFAASPIIGQGNPAITQHPDTPQGVSDKATRRGHPVCQSSLPERLPRALHGAPLRSEDTTTGECRGLHRSI